jgi:hypothetical protein
MRQEAQRATEHPHLHIAQLTKHVSCKVIRPCIALDQTQSQKLNSNERTGSFCASALALSTPAHWLLFECVKVFNGSLVHVFKATTVEMAIPVFSDHPKKFSSSKSKFDLQNRFLTLGWSRFEIRVSF